MSGYTIELTGRRAVVLGGGPRATAEVGALLDAGAHVSVVAVELGASLADLADRGLVTWHARTPQSEDLEADLVLRVAESEPSPSADTPPTLGTVTLVGAGPGDPGLLTVAGREALRAADVIVADRLVPHAALRDLSPGATVIDVAKIPGGRTTSQDRINEILVEAAREGRAVVRLKGGDPFVFGRGSEELLACADAGIATRVIPGITSSVAAPALAGIPVTHRGVTQGFTVVSGHVPPDHPDSTIDYAALARSGTTLVVLMGVRTLAKIATALTEAGLDAQTPAAVVADAGLPSQRDVRATVATIAEAAERADIRPPAVAVIGGVVDVLGEIR